MAAFLTLDNKNVFAKMVLKGRIEIKKLTKITYGV